MISTHPLINIITTAIFTLNTIDTMVFSNASGEGAQWLLPSTVTVFRWTHLDGPFGGGGNKVDLDKNTCERDG